VFTNDFPALLPEIDAGSPGVESSGDDLFRRQTVQGTCRVVCFSPRHDLTLPEMTHREIRGVVDTWAEQTAELSATYRWVQVFENKGAVQGCSNPHPHGQIWASDCLPNEAIKEDRQQREYHARHGEPLLVEYARRELEFGERLVVERRHWIALVPYWATWPFETLVLPRSAAVLRCPS
jgi:UDPglucose--hexose-1-phosphate uridylyltransferase